MTASPARHRPRALELPRSRVALNLPKGLSFDDWKKVGLPLLEAGQSVMWWVGDWLNYGESAYGETFTAAVEWTGMERQTLANAKWVCERVESSRRREDLSFGHHAAVAALDAETQVDLLELALGEGLSVQGLRAEVRRRNDAARQDAEAAALQASAALRRIDSVVSAGPPRVAPLESDSEVEAERPVVVADLAEKMVEGAVRLTVPARHERQLVEALNRTAAGLRSWFDGEGLDARVDILR